MLNKRLLCKTVSILSFLVLFDASAEIYKWTDENGKVHYSDDRRLSKKDNVQSVTVKDKYAVPKAKALKPIPNTNSVRPKTTVLTDINIMLKGSGRGDVLIGRQVCGRPIDIFWDQGLVKLDRNHVSPLLTRIFENSNYSFRAGDALMSASEVLLSANVTKLFINKCPADVARLGSTASAYVQIEWQIGTADSTRFPVKVKTSGSSHAIKARPSATAIETNVDAAFEMAVNNFLESALSKHC